MLFTERLECCHRRCRPADTEDGFTQGPVFQDWRGERFGGRGVGGLSFAETPKDSQLSFGGWR
jgi:hypothetical protein